jgi:membrane associated rhomboid family serine protease
VHADFMHLLFNMFALYSFGEYVENVFAMAFGSKWLFLVLYILGLILSDVSSYFRHKDNYGYRSIGASGAVSAVIFASIIFNPMGEIGLFFVIKLPAIIFGILFLVTSAYLAKKGTGGINHEAHFWGAVVGILFPIMIEPQLVTHFLNQIRFW